MAGKNFWRQIKFLEILCVSTLLGLNILVVWPFFGKAYPHRFSVPLVPFLGRGLELILPINFAQATTAIILVFYIFGVLALYFFVREVAGRRLPAFIAGAAYSLPWGWFGGMRIKGIFLYGDGAHIAALTFIPLAAYFALRFLKSGNFSFAIFGALGVTAAALTSPFGLMTLLIFLVVIVFSEALLGEGRLKLMRMAVLLLFAAGFSAFWYNPAFSLKVLVGIQGRDLLKIASNLLPPSFFIVPILGCFGFLLFERKPQLQPFFLALSLVFIFFLISFADWMEKIFPSHPGRYLPELGFGLAFFIGITSVWLVEFIRAGRRFFKRIRKELRGRVSWGFLILLVGLSVGGTLGGLRQTREISDLEQQVLGVQVTDFWAIRSESGAVANAIGYLTTLATVGVTSFLGKRFKKT